MGRRRKNRNRSSAAVSGIQSPAPAVIVDRSPFVAATMIVKDEEDFLEGAIRSAREWVDVVQIVDTGSTDRSIEIARDLGAEVSEFAWTGDFSAARNEALCRSKAKWNIQLDADERLRGTDPAAFRRELENTPLGYPFHVLMVKIVNTTLGGDELDTLWTVRVYPTDDRLGFTMPIHEVFGSTDPEHAVIRGIKYDDLEIQHLGYDPGVYAERRKSECRLPMIEQAVNDDPENFLHRYYLGREYYTVGRFEDAIRVLEDTLNRFKDHEAAEPDVIHECWLILLEAHRQAKHDISATLRVSEQGLSTFHDSPDLWFQSGRVLAEAGRHEQAIRYLSRALENFGCGFGDWSRVRHVTGQPWQIHAALGESLAQLGQFSEAYAAYLQAIDLRPAGSPGSDFLINCAIGLSLDLNDYARWGQLADRLLQGAPGGLDMLPLIVEKLTTRGAHTEARTIIDRARTSGAPTQLLTMLEASTVRVSA